jgi:hypothetical protein
MQTELIYEFQISLFCDNGKLIGTVNCGEFEFPSEERIQAAIEESGADYAKVERIYRMAEVPFT